MYQGNIHQGRNIIFWLSKADISLIRNWFCLEINKSVKVLYLITRKLNSTELILIPNWKFDYLDNLSTFIQNLMLQK